MMKFEIKIKQLGQTIEHEGEVILVSRDMPVNCMVLFVDMEIWHQIKDSVIMEKDEGKDG